MSLTLTLSPRGARESDGPLPSIVLAVCECTHHNTIMSDVMTIRVDRKTKNRLEKLAKAMDRTKSYVAAEAIRSYVELDRRAHV